MSGKTNSASRITSLPSISQAQIQEIRSSAPEGSIDNTCRDDVFSQVMGPERSGRVHVYGLGPTPTRLWGSSSIADQSSQRAHGERIKELEDKLEEMNAKIEDMEGLITNMNLRLLAMEAKMEGMDTSQGPSSGAGAKGGDAEE